MLPLKHLFVQRTDIARFRFLCTVQFCICQKRWAPSARRTAFLSSSGLWRFQHGPASVEELQRHENRENKTKQNNKPHWGKAFRKHILSLHQTCQVELILCCNVKLVMQKRKRKRERDRKREKKSLRMPGDEPRAPQSCFLCTKWSICTANHSMGGKKTDLKSMIASAKNKKLPVCLSKKQFFNSEAKQTVVLRDVTVKFTTPSLPLGGFERRGGDANDCPARRRQQETNRKCKVTDGSFPLSGWWVQHGAVFSTYYHYRLHHLHTAF